MLDSVAHDSFYVCSKQIAFDVFNNLNETFSAVQALRWIEHKYITWALHAGWMTEVSAPFHRKHFRSRACTHHSRRLIVRPTFFIPLPPAKWFGCTKSMNRSGWHFAGTTAISTAKYMSPKWWFVSHGALLFSIWIQRSNRARLRIFPYFSWRRWMIRMAAIPTKIYGSQVQLVGKVKSLAIHLRHYSNSYHFLKRLTSGSFKCIFGAQTSPHSFLQWSLWQSKAKSNERKENWKKSELSVFLFRECVVPYDGANIIN